MFYLYCPSFALKTLPLFYMNSNKLILIYVDVANLILSLFNAIGIHVTVLSLQISSTDLSLINPQRFSQNSVAFLKIQSLFSKQCVRRLTLALGCCASARN